MYRMMVCAAVLAFMSSVAFAGCGKTNCSVGALGNGGVQSGGAAQGSHEKGQEFGSDFTNSGTSTSGHLNVVDPSGSLSGHLHPDGTSTGRTTGFFGECTGQC